MYNVLISFKVARPIASISLILTGVLVFVVTEYTLYFVLISDQFNPCDSFVWPITCAVRCHLLFWSSPLI